MIICNDCGAKTTHGVCYKCEPMPAQEWYKSWDHYKASRDKAIYDRRMLGMTYVAIGREFGLGYYEISKYYKRHCRREGLPIIKLSKDIPK